MRREKWLIIGTISLIAIFLFFFLFLYPMSINIKEERKKMVKEIEVEKEKVGKEEEKEKNCQALYPSLGIQKINPSVKAEDFTLENLAGSRVSLEDFRNKVVFLNFWSTRCGPCRTEMPSMEILWQVFKDDEFIILAVNLGEEKNGLSSFMQKNGYTFPVLLDSGGRLANIYEIRAIPTTYLLDPEGRIVGKALGARNWASEGAFDLIECLFSKKKTG